MPPTFFKMQSEEELTTLLSLNDDILVGVTSFLGPKEMVSSAKSCTRFRSLAERTACQFHHAASSYERAALPKYGDESWIELYHHLLKLRSPLVFSRLIGSNIRYDGDESRIGVICFHEGGGCAICGEQVMRAGKHYAIFKKSNDDEYSYAGIIRPIKGLNSEEMEHFEPISGMDYSHRKYREVLRRERTERWGMGDINCVKIEIGNGYVRDSTWNEENDQEEVWSEWEGKDCGGNFVRGAREIGLLLDLDSTLGGTLSVYQNGRFVSIIADRLWGEFCWHASVCPMSHCTNVDWPDACIERGNLEALS